MVMEGPKTTAIVILNFKLINIFTTLVTSKLPKSRHEIRSSQHERPHEGKEKKIQKTVENILRRHLSLWPVKWIIKWFVFLSGASRNKSVKQGQKRNMIEKWLWEISTELWLINSSWKLTSEHFVPCIVKNASLSVNWLMKRFFSLRSSRVIFFVVF